MPTNSPVPLHGDQDQSKSNTSQFPCKHQGTSTRRALRRDSRTKLKHSAGDMIQPRTSMDICCSSTVKRSGATVEGVILGYPYGGPIQPLGQRVGRADYSRRDTLGLLAMQDFMKLPPDRDRVRPTLYTRGTVVTD